MSYCKAVGGFDELFDETAMKLLTHQSQQQKESVCVLRTQQYAIRLRLPKDSVGIEIPFFSTPQPLSDWDAQNDLKLDELEVDEFYLYATKLATSYYDLKKGNTKRDLLGYENHLMSINKLQRLGLQKFFADQISDLNCQHPPGFIFFVSPKKINLSNTVFFVCLGKTRAAPTKEVIEDLLCYFNRVHFETYPDIWNNSEATY